MKPPPDACTLPGGDRMDMHRVYRFRGYVVISEFDDGEFYMKEYEESLADAKANLDARRDKAEPGWMGQIEYMDSRLKWVPGHTVKGYGGNPDYWEPGDWDLDEACDGSAFSSR